MTEKPQRVMPIIRLAAAVVLLIGATSAFEPVSAAQEPAVFAGCTHTGEPLEGCASIWGAMEGAFCGSGQSDSCQNCIAHENSFCAPEEAACFDPPCKLDDYRDAPLE